MPLSVERAAEGRGLRAYHLVGVVAVAQIDVGCEHCINGRPALHEYGEVVEVVGRGYLHHFVWLGILSHHSHTASCQAYQSQQER